MSRRYLNDEIAAALQRNLRPTTVSLYLTTVNGENEQMRFAGGRDSRLLLCICGAVAAVGAAAGPAGASASGAGDHPKLIWGPERDNGRAASERLGTGSRLLWGRDFVATSVSDRGRQRKPPITEPSDVSISFSASPGHHWIGWEVNCNGYGARVKTRHGRLILSELVGTAIACPGPPTLEDRWLGRFFEANPHWSLRGSHLRLWAGDRHMTLIEKT